jgi:hypothetical protein
VELGAAHAASSKKDSADGRHPGGAQVIRFPLERARTDLAGLAHRRVACRFANHGLLWRSSSVASGRFICGECHPPIAGVNAVWVGA